MMQSQLKAKSSFEGKPYDIVIVGGGPCGLSCAISLAKHGFDNIAILETKSDFKSMDWARSYCYRIDGHGGKWLNEVNAMDEFRQVACKTPDVLCTIMPDGSSQTVTSIMKDVHQESFWLWRNDLLQFLLKLLNDRHSGKVDVHFGTKCEAVERHLQADGTWTLEILVEEQLASGPNRIRLQPQFIIGSDGVHSIVRHTMAKWDSKFAVKTIPHLTTGLPFKALNLKVSEDMAPTGTFLLVKGLNKESFGVFPQRADRVRLTGCVRRPTHPIWKISDVDELYTYLQANWPQLNWRETLSNEAAAAFIDAAPVKFPDVSYCTHFQFSMKAQPNRGKLGDQCGIMLVGDAIHCFPPDLGQGVNASLEDVYVFDTALHQAGDLSSALPLFEDLRKKDVYAIAHLLPIGAPYQYNLPFSLHKLGWHIDFVLRLLGSKLLPFAINQPVAFGLQNPKNSYWDLLQGHRRTTTVLQATGAVVAVCTAVLCRFGGRTASFCAAICSVCGLLGVTVMALRQRPDLGKAKK